MILRIVTNTLKKCSHRQKSPLIELKVPSYKKGFSPDLFKRSQDNTILRIKNHHFSAGEHLEKLQLEVKTRI